VTFLLSVVALTSVYVVVGILERRPALRFRLLPSPRPYLATDTAWYGLAIVATAVSVFAFQPVLSQLALFGSLVRADTLPDDRYGVPGEIDTFPQAFGRAFREPISRRGQRRASSIGNRSTNSPPS
jgi:hypothetical protein